MFALYPEQTSKYWLLNSNSAYNVERIQSAQYRQIKQINAHVGQWYIIIYGIKIKSHRVSRGFKGDAVFFFPFELTGQLIIVSYLIALFEFQLLTQYKVSFTLVTFII